MPIAAVAVAVIADVGVASVGLAAAGTFEVIGAIGATVAAVGAVTKNKTLMIAGSVLGGIGGIGALASSAGIIADPTVSSFFGPSTAASTADAADAAATTDSFSGLGSPTGAIDSTTAATDPAAAASSASGDIINNLGQSTGAGVGLANSDLGVPDLNAALGLPSNPATALGDTTALSNTASDAAIAGSASASGATAGVTLPPVTGSGVADAATAAGNAVTGAPASTASDGGIFGKIGDFFNDPKTGGAAKYGLVQAAGSLVGGMFDPLKPAQVAALDAQAAANRAATSLSLTQQANMAQPIPVASRTAQPQPAAVTGIPVGMINQPVAAPVTGAVGA